MESYVSSGKLKVFPNLSLSGYLFANRHGTNKVQTTPHIF
jgi:hypothetical protein